MDLSDSPVMSCPTDTAKGKLEKTLGFVEKVAMLTWMIKGDEGKAGVAATTAMQVGLEVWNMVTKESEITALREHTLLSIVEFIKQNPRASEDAIQTELARRIELFAAQVSAL